MFEATRPACLLQRSTAVGGRQIHCSQVRCRARAVALAKEGIDWLGVWSVKSPVAQSSRELHRIRALCGARRRAGHRSRQDLFSRPLHSQLSSKDSQLYSAHRAPLPASAPSKTAAAAQMITARRVGLSMGLLQNSATKSNAMPTKAVFQHTSERTSPKPIAAAIKYARRAQK